MPAPLFFLPLLAIACLSQAAPDAEFRERWSVHGKSDRKLDHGAWKDFLAQYLDTTAGDKINRLRYGEVTGADQGRLQAYLAGLEGEPVSRLNRPEQKAYWINLYNAKTVAVVLQAHPVGSIRDIKLSSVPLKAGPWDAKILKVEGIELSLNDIENRILRPLWKDSRVHFALNCASLGCPDLAAIPFTAANSDSLLETGAAAFIQSHRGARFDGPTLVLSSIFDWYKEDFGTTRVQVVAFVSRYATPALRKKLAEFKGSIKYQYDWKLNDAGPGR